MFHNNCHVVLVTFMVLSFLCVYAWSGQTLSNHHFVSIFVQCAEWVAFDSDILNNRKQFQMYIFISHLKIPAYKLNVVLFGSTCTVYRKMYTFFGLYYLYKMLCMQYFTVVVVVGEQTLATKRFVQIKRHPTRRKITWNADKSLLKHESGRNCQHGERNRAKLWTKWDMRDNLLNSEATLCVCEK